jgi:hypothetical protein
MATQTIKRQVDIGLGSSMVAKAVLANLVVFLIAIAVLNLTTGTLAFAAGFAFGFLLGAGNIYWLSRISRKMVRMDMEKALKYAMLNYYGRFFMVILAFAAIIILGIFNPWQPLVGFIASSITTIVMFIVPGGEGAKDAS